ncbi:MULTISPECIES: EamA family transporter [unclassified Streptomyces]|uniref:EamA family transporter n=1 Tax=unclassified Streptomyces TaxID=2593676 RepID=UPI002DDA3CEE|nr:MULTISPECIES: EamA family transporter [unclassified Streptomyces]WSA91265.1 DMT family transporter [Streptomyces sp. NBC_01795]WSB75589.1 DMT family transporter [Streptomyces sp. NBC_01775]WSS16126.1 DMT family transporter [Streptomyces sp. NBC_01186]WSS44945.1 DMT family transporter [Streptomyces sp. NBC_01187]
MDTRTNGPLLGAGLVLGAAVLWGTVGPAQVLASSPMTPTALGGWRLVVGGLILGMFTICLPPRFFRSARMPGISRDRRITSAETLEPLASGERSSQPASQFRTSA